VTALLVQDYLRSGGTFESLFEEHAVRAKPHNGKVSFVYDQLAASNSNALACQCRGLVLRETSWDVVAYPFDRFFNHGQQEAARIDWGTARFEEKLDGTLLIVYWDDFASRWMCATRSMCEAHGNINGVGTFAELADRAARGAGVGARSLHDLMDGVGADRCATYMFELTGPYNQIVCRYESLGLTLLGVRDLSTFSERCPVTESSQLGFATPRTWRFDNISHLIEVISEWNPTEFEGIVARDDAFRRVKVKSPKYLAVAHAGESLGSSWRSVCEAVASGAVDDIEAMLPILAQERVGVVKVALADVVQQTESDWAELRGIDDMKTFALAAQKRVWPAALFLLKRGKAQSVSAAVKAVSGDHVLSLVEKAIPGLVNR
jgi:hypothetical protein